MSTSEATATAPAVPGKLPYWLVNVDPSLHSADCPEWLANVDYSDKRVLETPDAEYKMLDWREVKEIVAENRIDEFRRVPSELRKYLEYNWKLKQRYGSVMRFIIEERLKWTSVQPENPVPFASSNDYTIKLNDWPYGLLPNIIHMVVWTKFPFEEDKDIGDLTESSRAVIDDFVERTFRAHLPEEDVIWFRNWTALKSIHAVEHFHVMLNKPDMEFVKMITNKDTPLIERV